MDKEDTKKLVSMLRPPEYESKIKLYCNPIHIPSFRPFSFKLLIKQ